MRRALLRLTVGAAGIEHGAGLPPSVTRIQAFNRTNTPARISWNPGEVESGGIDLTDSYDSGPLSGVSRCIYFASDVVGTIIEVYAWHHTNRTVRAFSDGFSHEFA